ncbi:MAG: type II toxin-antitoxin system RelE/ParE family toxin [bacterium]
MTYKIFETEEFSKKLKEIDKKGQRFIESKLKSYIYPQLAQRPQYGNNIKKLRGYVPDTWRYRIGNFRVFYIINEEEKVVDILSIKPRKTAYD